MTEPELHLDTEAQRERLTELEIRIAYQDRQVRELREVIDSFAGRLAGLEHDLLALRATTESPPSTTGAGNDPPPHY